MVRAPLIPTTANDLKQARYLRYWIVDNGSSLRVLVLPGAPIGATVNPTCSLIALPVISGMRFVSLPTGMTMPSQYTIRQSTKSAANQEAHLLLTHLIERVGLNRRSFLARLADLGHLFSDYDLANWGRAGRSFPNDWAALRAMIQVVTEGQPATRRCTAAEALRFFGLVGMPFPELRSSAALFPADEFSSALAAYMPAAFPEVQPAAGGEVAAGGIGQAQQMEGVPPEPTHSHVITQGLSALIALMRAPEVHTAVLAFRIDFQAACEQIGILAGYKRLHDLFQQLEDRYYLIYHDVKRLPADPSAWASIEHNARELQAIADDLLDIAGPASMRAITALWTHKLARTGGELRTSIKNHDRRLLKSAMSHLKDLLGREPSRINTRLVSAAGALRLSRLVTAMATVAHTLGRLRLEQVATHQFEAFETGVAALARLADRVTAAIAYHNAFQEIDDELRRVEVLLDQDVRELTYAWQYIKPMILKLCDSSQASWALKLNAMGAELERTFETEDLRTIKPLFRSYRSQASRSFNQVDRDLLTLCEELQKVDEPLATLLKLIT